MEKIEKSMTKDFEFNVFDTDGSEKNGGIKIRTNPSPRPPVTPPPQKPAPKKQ